jgi:DNA adenine methylase
MQLSFREMNIAPPLKVVNVASVSQLSPFRYPGGKTWLVPFVMRWLEALPTKPRVLVDPFLGGGSVPLNALREGAVDHLVLREIDEDVGAVWQCIFSGSFESLCEKILSFRVSREAVTRELKKPSATIPDRAFQTILKNRTYRGGILAQGSSLMRAGENGRGIRSRWYPQTLVNRIRELSRFSKFVDFRCADGFGAIREHKNDPQAVLFVDPPYTAGNGKRAGKRLYTHNQLDHAHLFSELAACRGQFLITYDDDPDVVALARRFKFTVQRVPMKSTHHVEKFELVITRPE